MFGTIYSPEQVIHYTVYPIRPIGIRWSSTEWFGTATVCLFGGWLRLYNVAYLCGVAEEIRKLEEEERQRQEAEHRAEAVRQVQAPESPMRVNDGSGDDGDAEEEAEKKGKEKEKEKEKDGWEIVGGSGRCKACRKEETACKINLGKIEKWRKSTEKGKVYKKAPAATSCQRCMEVRRKSCILPATEECRRKLENLGKPTKLTIAPSASLGRKRPLEDADRGLPPKRKQKKAEENLLTEEEFRTEVADALGSIAVNAARFARAAELQNFLLQQLVEALGGVGLYLAACRKKGNWRRKTKRTNRTRRMSRKRGRKKNRERNRERSRERVRKSESEWSSTL